MKLLPMNDYALVLKTASGHEKAWAGLRKALRRPDAMGSEASVDLLDDPDFHGLTPAELRGRVPEGYHYAFIFVADDATLASREYPLLVVELAAGSTHEFRAIPSTIASMENWLVHETLDFEDYLADLDDDGVYRGARGG